MSGCALPRPLSARRSRFVWRRIVRYGEPLEHRRLLSGVSMLPAAFDGVAALPAAQASSPITNSMPFGDTPDQIRNAYGFNQVTFDNGTSAIAGNGAGQTIAIVDAYGDSSIVGDVRAFDSQFGLADPALTVVNQNGGTSLPGNNGGWALETALDVEWAHAIAPQAKLLLVEASDASLGNLLTAVNYARNQPGVVAVSMSWGVGEFSAETAYDGYFTTPTGHGGVTFVAASGDDGAATIWPAASGNVLATGGTELNTGASGNYLGETAWSGSGGGLSLYESQPTYQSQSGLVTQSTTQRTVPDIAYNADPASGVAVYDSISYGGATGWFQVGGTSAAAPQIAALVAVADQGRQIANGGVPNPLPNAQASLYSVAASATSYSTDFHNVAAGSNGSGQLASTSAGYNLATGLGTPNAAALVQGLVNSQATPVVSTAATTGGKPGIAAPETVSTPAVLVEIIILATPPTTVPTAVPIVATPGTNTSTPAVSLALPSAEAAPFAVNSLITDDPSAVPFKPLRRASPAAEAPPAGTTAPSLPREAVHDVLKTFGAALFEDSAPLPGEEDASSAPDAGFSETLLAEAFNAADEVASGVSSRVCGAASLAGLVALAALVDRPGLAPQQRRQAHLRRPRARLPR